MRWIIFPFYYFYLMIINNKWPLRVCRRVAVFSSCRWAVRDHMINAPWVIDDRHANEMRLKNNPFDYNVLFCLGRVASSGLRKRCLISIDAMMSSRLTGRREKTRNQHWFSNLHGLAFLLHFDRGSRQSNFNKFECKQHINISSGWCVVSTGCVQ